MKKTIFTLMLMIASAITVNAQSLTGKEWCTMIPDEEGNEIALEMEFKQNGLCEIELETKENINEGGMNMVIEVDLDVPGTYTLEGKKLDVKLKKESAKIDIDCDINGVDAQTKAMVKQMMKPELEKSKLEVQQEMLKSLPNLEGMSIVSLDDNTLVIADASGKNITFHAK